MTAQQKLLWQKITKDVRDLGEGNLRARELYDELCKLLNMSDKVLVSITEKENGLEVKIGEDVYGNLAIVGLLEKIKLNILDGLPEEKAMDVSVSTTGKYDA
jgi:hypothetical protein